MTATTRNGGAEGNALEWLGGAYVIHLDQWVWVKLAVAVREKAGDYWNLYELLRECRTEGLIELPLSAQNYLELWNRRKTTSRKDYERSQRLCDATCRARDPA